MNGNLQIYEIVQSSLRARPRSPSYEVLKETRRKEVVLGHVSARYQHLMSEIIANKQFEPLRLLKFDSLGFFLVECA